jgi:hypothetical protein
MEHEMNIFVHAYTPQMRGIDEFVSARLRLGGAHR